jgi:hypothetical protein
MANRFFNQFGKTLEKEVVSLFLHATFGASGAVTLDAVNSKGIASMTKIGTGAYRIVFGTTPKSLDVYYKFFAAMATFKTGGSPAAAQDMYITDLKHNIVGSCYIDVQFNDSGASTNPGSGEEVFMEIKLGNSSAQ